MSIVTLATLVLACATLAVAAPADEVPADKVVAVKVPSMDLEHVLKASVCPIDVYYDELEHRIPRRIKMLRCGNMTETISHHKNMTQTISQDTNKTGAWCRLHHDHSIRHCVNVLDHVLVRYTNRGDVSKLHKFEVKVGCICIVLKEAKAQEDR